jgi:hypothetical protein
MNSVLPARLGGALAEAVLLELDMGEATFS